MSDTILETPSQEAPPSHGAEPAPSSGDWRSSIPAEYQKEPFWSVNMKDKGLPDVLKSSIEAHKKLGGAIFLPSEKDKPEDRAKKIHELYGKLGRPDSPDKYQITQPALPEGATWDPNRETAFKAVAHQLNFTPQQVQGLIDWYGKDVADSLVAREQGWVQTRKETEAALHNEWGGAYQSNVVLANRAVEELGKQAGLTQDESTQVIATMGNDPGFLKMMAKLGTFFRNDGLITGDAPSTSDSIQTQINELMKKPEYWNKHDPQYEAMQEKVQKLFQSHTDPMAKAMRGEE